MSSRREFTMLGARSGSFVAGISIALAVESVALHFLLRGRAPWLDWAVIISSVATLGWIVRDYRAIGATPIVVTTDELRIALGRRFTAIVPRSRVSSATIPTWRDLPDPLDKSYLKLSGTTRPNVLVRFDAPVAFSGLAGITRRASVVGLRIDEPEQFVGALAGPAGPHA
ncbi:MAG: hypothetical protein ABJD07_02775 [Gemmatimonadaceae bacterium]